MIGRPLMATWLGAVLLAIAAVLPGPGMANDHAHIAVVITGGEPIRALVTWGDEADRSDAFIVTVLDRRGIANGWTANLEAHGSFRIVGTIGSSTAAPAPGVITIRQGNRSIGGHELVRYRTDTPSDAIRWSVARFFGDGEYRLTVPGKPNLPMNGTGTVVLTICGGAP